MQWAAIVSLVVSFALFVFLGRAKKRKKAVFVFFALLPPYRYCSFLCGEFQGIYEKIRKSALLGGFFVVIW